MHLIFAHNVEFHVYSKEKNSAPLNMGLQEINQIKLILKTQIFKTFKKNIEFGSIHLKNPNLKLKILFPFWYDCKSGLLGEP